MRRYYAKQEVLDDSGKHVATEVFPVYDSIRVLAKKFLRDREGLWLKQGQRYAGRVRVYRVMRDGEVPHGVYIVDSGKLIRGAGDA
tara:strand:+ start:35 stop:292 length:258 start_codon:yes stop_codon:yes gene_type:complete